MKSNREGPAAILERHGPLESAEFAKQLVAAGVARSLTNARKAIERSVGRSEIHSTSPVRFDKTYLYYLEKHLKRKYAPAIRKLLKSKPSFDRVFKVLLSNKGFITEGQIAKASGCLPDDVESKAGGRQKLSDVVDQLCKIRLVAKDLGNEKLFKIGEPFGQATIRRSTFLRKLEFDGRLLQEFRNWVRNCYLVGFDSHSVRDSDLSASAFNDSFWDLHGPVYMGPFSKQTPLSRSVNSGSFVIADLMSYRTYSAVDAEGFLDRVRHVSHRWKRTNFVPLIVAPSFSKLAWTILRNEGISCLTSRDVFGPNIDELMRRLTVALSADTADPENVKSIEECLQVANGTIVDEGLLGNLKGALFEVLIAFAFRALGYDTTLQKMILNPIEDKEYDVDVVVTRGEEECKVVECKGRHAKYLEDVSDIERHFVTRCEVAADEFGWDVVNRYTSVEAIYITSGQFSVDALEFAKSMRKSHGIHCSTMDRNQLLEFLKTSRQTRLIKIIKQFYSQPFMAEAKV